MNWKEKALAATSGSQFGAVLCAATGTEAPPPCFTSKASVTSDGYVMADFTGKDGQHHMGAFVGSATDLVNNTVGLADHLKLSAAERAELFATVRGWIGADHGGGGPLKALEAGR